jgi:hypothetical protein
MITAENDDFVFSLFDPHDPELQKDLLIDEILENKKQLAKLQKDVNNIKIINELHIYNEIKDIAQEILGYLATVKNISVKQLYEELNISDNENN